LSFRRHPTRWVASRPLTSIPRSSARRYPTIQEKVSKKEPYSLYPSLEKKGVRIVWGDPQAASSAPSDEFDVVYDNNGKKLEACQPLIDKYKARFRWANSRVRAGDEDSGFVMYDRRGEMEGS